MEVVEYKAREVVTILISQEKAMIHEVGKEEYIGNKKGDNGSGQEPISDICKGFPIFG